MLSRLALRNVRRQSGSYLLYFLTVVFTISMLFAVENLLYSAELEKISEKLSDISTIINFSVIIVTIVSAIVLGYTSAFMVKLRAREFGLYLTMGMRRRDIMVLFVAETAIISLFATAAGFALGVFVYQMLMNLLMRIMGILFDFSALSGKATLLSFLTSALIFLLSSLFSLRYLGKASIAALLAPPKSEKATSHRNFWLLLLILSGGAMVSSFYQTFTEMKRSLSGEDSGGSLMAMLGLCILFCFIFHFVLSKLLFASLSESKKLMGRGGSSVIIRNLQGKATSNALLMGTLSVLFLISVGATSVSVTEKAINDMDIDKSVPYSVMAFSNPGNEEFLSKTEEITQEECGIEEIYRYSVYTSGKCDFFRNVKGREEMNMRDYFISLSDFNSLLKGFGREEVKLNDGEYIIASRYREIISDVEFPDVDIDGKTYRCREASYSYPDFQDRMMVVVIPNEALSSFREERKCLSISTLVSPKDIFDFHKRLVEIRGEGDRVWNREEAKLEADSTSGVLIIAMLFVSTVSTALSLAILSVKTLSSVSEDKVRMGILRSLGVDRDGRRRTMAIETLIFFLLPLIIPLILSIPVAAICAMVYEAWGMYEMVEYAYITVAAVDAFILIVSILYYLITLRLKITATTRREGERRE